MSVGKLSEFNIIEGNWQVYCDRLEMFFKVNQVKDDLQLPTLIATMGDAAYELLVNLSSPSKPAEMKYEEVKEIMRQHLNPKPSVLAERFIFRQRRQGVGEKIQNYVAELKRLTRFCEFNTSLDENLRDQFICGIKSDAIRQQLFANENITFKKAVILASALEAAERDAAAVEASASVVSASGGSARAGQTMTAADTTKRSSTGMDDSVYNMHIGGCRACGDFRHQWRDCKFKEYQCSRCRKVGHLRRKCPENEAMDHFGNTKSAAYGGDGGGGGSGGGGQGRWRMRGARGGGGRWRSGSRVTTRGRANAHWVMEDEAEATTSDGDGAGGEESIYQMSLGHYKPVSILIDVNLVNLSMEIDTGSPLSCINYETYVKHFKYIPLQKSNLSVKFYNLSKVTVLGMLEVKVKYKDICKTLDLYVFKTGATSLLGRQWLAELNIPVPMFTMNKMCLNELDSQQKNNIVNDMISRHKELFDGELGCFTGGLATLRLRAGAEPLFYRARPLPYSLRARVDAELDAMLRTGVIEPVDCSDWATPLVIVHKPDGALRICVDYKVTLNKVLHVDKYPVPKIDDLFSKLRGSRYFTKLDLSQAYNQILLDDTRNLTVINTHRGLFKYNRLVYGLASSPGIFQRIMMKLFQTIPNVTIFLDDILISTSDWSSHMDTLNKVMQVLSDNGLKIKKEKCEFLCEEVKYLGFIVNSQGIKVDPKKIEPIVKISPPGSVSELKSFLGMINFYGKFIKNLGVHLSPLHELLRKGQHWYWGHRQNKAFNFVKESLVSSEVLVHYDESREIIVTCDASSRGIGAVLAQRVADGRERPVAYASRALNEAERNYSQIHKEALAIVYAVKKFHQYLYGREFILKTDHKPLVSIFGPELGIPSMTASRLQRWALILSAYNFTIEYIRTDANTADALSRLVEGYRTVNKKNKENEIEPEQTYLHFASEALLLNYEDVKRETRKDPILGRILSYIRDGWPQEIDLKELRPYFNRRTELYSELGCIMWGYRLVVPKTCQDKVLRELHDTHMGIVKCKCIARSYVWWPGVDEAIEAMCRGCGVCAEIADAPPHHAPQPWGWPTRPWTRLHIDFLGPIGGFKYLVVIDACSKWIEICKMNSTTASAVVSKLRDMWARFGLPRQVVSDNGPPFSSEEFNSFLTNNGIEHTFSAPYHPSSNGAAENAVKICKNIIKKAFQQGLNVEVALQRYLLMYRTTEHSTTGETPAQMLQGRPLRTRLDRLKPARQEMVAKAQQRQQRYSGGGHRILCVGDAVWYRTYQGPSKWLEGQVLERLGKTDYNIKTSEGTVVHRHIDQLKLKASQRQSVQFKCNKFQDCGKQGLLLSPDLTNEPERPTLSEKVTGSTLQGEGQNKQAIDEGGRENGSGVAVSVPIGSQVPADGDAPGGADISDRRYPIRLRRPPPRFQNCII